MEKGGNNMAKILTVDDSEFMRSLLKKALNASGYTEIIEASNGDEALEKFNSEKPDLVLMDIVMTESMSGVDTLKKIKAADANAKVIMVTVVDQPKVTEEAMAAGAVGYVTKPVDEKKLVEEVKKALG